MKNIQRTLPVLAFILSSSLANAQVATTDFDYISGGFHYTHLSHEFTSSHYFHNETQGETIADSMAGAFLKGSWNFTHRLYITGRVELSKRNQVSLAHQMAGIGFYQPLSKSLSFFTTLGVTHLNLEQGENTGHKNQHYSESGASAEAGLRFSPCDNWIVEPSFRTDQLKHTLNEYRIGNIFNVSNNMNIEANFSYSTIEKYSMSSYQLGVRYAF
ncbi:hypothetical protein [Photobacterium sp. DNB22_13_2]